jgi:dGTPase
MKLEKIAPYACRPELSRGRLYYETETPNRTPFQRDRDRLIHSSAFRKLKSKTQVFVYHEGEDYRTRLTHTIEVSQIARSICRHLGLNQDLAEALALAHDFGHPAFGHAGEDALKECMKDYGGFDHNAQSLRIVTSLEQRYAEFDGLNLTWETLEGLVKHNGPLMGKDIKNPVHGDILEFNRKFDLELDTYPSAEAQVASLADDIAYNNHDLDDGFHAGLFSLNDLKEVPLVGPMIVEVQGMYPEISQSRLVHEVVRRIIHGMINDLVTETKRRVRELAPQSAGDVRKLKTNLVSFSDKMQMNNKAFKEFLFPHMYRHHRVNRMRIKTQKAIKEMFTLLVAEPILLPSPWREATKSKSNTPLTAKVVCDYIASMTDISAIEEHTKLTDPKVRP